MSSRTAAGNIEYPLRLAGVPKEERKRRVEELLQFVGLGDKGSNYPEQLSGGQKQRVGIARALSGARVVGGVHVYQVSGAGLHERGARTV